VPDKFELTLDGERGINIASGEGRYEYTTSQLHACTR
jgi:hypothetical protein